MITGARQVCASLSLGEGDHAFIVVPSQYEAGVDAEFALEVYARRSEPAAKSERVDFLKDEKVNAMELAGDDPELAEALLLSMGIDSGGVPQAEQAPSVDCEVSFLELKHGSGKDA